MTPAQRSKYLPPSGFFRERLWIWLFGMVVSGSAWAAGAAFLALATPIGEHAKAIWESPRAIDDIQNTLTDIKDGLARANGEDRVIRQPDGLSYVAEPVHVGDLVVVHLVIERTRLGSDCAFLGGQSLFSDRTNILLPGSKIPVQRQVGREQTRLRVVLTAPETLETGRIEVYLALDFECGGKRISDRTDTMIYQLLPRKGK